MNVLVLHSQKNVSIRKVLLHIDVGFLARFNNVYTLLSHCWETLAIPTSYAISVLDQLEYLVLLDWLQVWSGRHII